jgi:lipoate-protein ligase A
MPVARLRSTDPYLNLAIEEHLLHHGWPGRPHGEDPILLLWVSSPSIVIGRHQNPWIECRLPALISERLSLVRRISGGGTVYHDPGNLNISFISPPGAYDQRLHFDVVCAALASLGARVTVNRRNDVVTKDPSGVVRKVSGSAFRHTRGRSLHHGTLLINADLNRLRRVLAPADLPLTTTAIRSVRSSVTNLSDIDPAITVDRVTTAMIEAYRARFGDDVVKDVAGDAVEARMPGVSARRNELRSWEWLFGRTPPFTHTVSGVPSYDTVELGVRHATIVAVSSPGDEPVPDGRTAPDARPGSRDESMSRLSSGVVGCRYDARELRARAGREEDDTVRQAVLYLSEELQSWTINLLDERD